MADDYKYFIDDRFIISDEVKKMSKEERKREIARMEQEIKEKKQNAQNQKKYLALKFKIPLAISKKTCYNVLTKFKQIGAEKMRIFSCK